jgi:cold-inducible RNA-binding protein
MLAAREHITRSHLRYQHIRVMIARNLRAALRDRFDLRSRLRRPRVSRIQPPAVVSVCLRPREPFVNPEKQELMGTRLYVGNLSFDTADADLVGAFEQDGRKVSSAQVVTDRDTGRSRGFAFVEMASAADAQAAIKAMDGVQLDGRALRVNEAEERKARTGGNASGGAGKRDRW